MQAETPGISTTLARLAAEGMDAGKIADATIEIWHKIDAVLAPIIGHAGVTALYNRSLYLTCADHPCLRSAYEATPASDAYAPLQASLSRQTRIAAATAVAALLQTFHGLLTHLIGESLSERLLRSVWENPSSGHAVEDIVS